VQLPCLNWFDSVTCVIDDYRVLAMFFSLRETVTAVKYPKSNIFKCKEKKVSELLNECACDEHLCAKQIRNGTNLKKIKQCLPAGKMSYLSG